MVTCSQAWTPPNPNSPAPMWTRQPLTLGGQPGHRAKGLGALCVLLGIFGMRGSTGPSRGLWTSYWSGCWGSPLEER